MIDMAGDGAKRAPAGCVMVGIGATEDGNHASGALRWAAQQAHHIGRTLCLVHAWSPWELRPATVAASLYGCLPGAQQIQDDRDHAARQLEAAARQLGHSFPDLPIRTRLLEGQPAHCLAAVSIGADSLVLGPSRVGRLRGAGRRMCVSVAAGARVPIVRVRPTSSPEGPVVAVSYRLDELAAVLPVALRLSAQHHWPVRAVIIVRDHRPHRQARVVELEAALFDLLASSRAALAGVEVTGAVVLETPALEHLSFTDTASDVIMACPRGHTAPARARRREVSRIVAQIPGSAVLVPTGP
jgi:hypothetical protein